MPPGVILVQPGIERDVLDLVRDVECRRDAVHGGVRRGTEHVFARRLLEDPGRATVVEHGERLQLFGDRDDCETAARGDVTEYGVDVVALDQVAVFGDLVGGRAHLIDVFRHDLGAPEARRVVGSGRFAGVERFDDDFGGVAAGNAERRCGRTGQERYDAELHVGSCRGGLLSLSRTGPEMHQSRGRNQPESGKRAMLHGQSSPGAGRPALAVVARQQT